MPNRWPVSLHELFEDTTQNRESVNSLVGARALQPFDALVFAVAFRTLAGRTLLQRRDCSAADGYSSEHPTLDRPQRRLGWGFLETPSSFQIWLEGVTISQPNALDDTARQQILALGRLGLDALAHRADEGRSPGDRQRLPESRGYSGTWTRPPERIDGKTGNFSAGGVHRPWPATTGHVRRSVHRLLPTKSGHQGRGVDRLGHGCTSRPCAECGRV